MVALDRLKTLFRTLHERYHRISADAIINTSLDNLTGMYIELAAKSIPIRPVADR